MGCQNIKLDNCTFKDNTANNNGGAIFSDWNARNLTINKCHFEDNSAKNGQSIFTNGATDSSVSNSYFKQKYGLHVSGEYLSLTATVSADYADSVSGSINKENLSYWDGKSYNALENEAMVNIVNQSVTVEIYGPDGQLIDNVTKLTNGNGKISYDYSHLELDDYTYKVYTYYKDSKILKEGNLFSMVSGNRFSDIQNAIDAATAGDTLYLKGVTYINDIKANMIIDKPLTIIGTEGTILDAEGYSRIFNIKDNVNDVNLRNITFVNGNEIEKGAAINIGENCQYINIVNSNFTNNHVSNSGQQEWGDNYGHGGAISISRSSHNGNVINSIFVNNTASASGGAIKNFGGQGWKIDNSTFINNTAYGLLQNNPSHVPNGGGAIWSCLSLTLIENSTFIGNQAPYGGAIRGFVDTYDTEFYLNVATNGNGGAIDVTIDSQVGRPDLKFVNTTFVDNSAKGKRSDDRAQGGALHMYNINHVDMIDCKCFNNTADRGGAIDLYVIGTTIVDNCIVLNNTAHSEGGGFYINTTSSPCEFYNSNISNNKAGTDGGAIYLITNGAFFDNITSINNTAQRGGSAFIRGNDAIIQHSTFNNNSAIGNGINTGIGGALDILGNNCQLINVTSKYNNASLGGSTFIRGNHTKIKASTFDYNNATLRGGGINVAGDDCNVTDVYVSGNFAGTDGGAVYIKGHRSSFVYVTSINNTACRGGSTFIEGDYVDVHNCTLDGNKAVSNGSAISGRGGGLDIAGEHCTIYDLDVSNNTADHEGGAFYVKSNNIHFYDIYSVNNTAQRGGSSFILGNNITVSNSTFDNNKAIYNGTEGTGLGGALDVLGNDCKFIRVTSLNNNATLGGSTLISETVP